MSSVPLQAAESWEQMPAFFTAHAATVLMAMSLREHVLLWACVALFLLVGSYAGRYGSVPRFWNLWPADFLRAVSGEDAELSSLGRSFWRASAGNPCLCSLRLTDIWSFSSCAERAASGGFRPK